MGLGNNISMGQSRGKNKPVLVKRIKERHLAKDYSAFPASDVAADANAACALAPLPNTYYHDGSSSLPDMGDFVFSRKRAHEDFWLPNGSYKFNTGSAFKAVTITNGRVSRIDNCK